MSGNGRLGVGLLEGFADRFARVLTPRPKAIEMPEPPPPDPEAPVRAAVAAWDSDDRAIFIAWVRENMDMATRNAHTARASHAEVSYQLGIEAALRFVVDRLTQWAR